MTFQGEGFPGGGAEAWEGVQGGSEGFGFGEVVAGDEQGPAWAGDDFAVLEGVGEGLAWLVGGEVDVGGHYPSIS